MLLHQTGKVTYPMLLHQTGKVTYPMYLHHPDWEGYFPHAPTPDWDGKLPMVLHQTGKVTPFSCTKLGRLLNHTTLLHQTRKVAYPMFLHQTRKVSHGKQQKATSLQSIGNLFCHCQQHLTLHVLSLIHI